MCVFVCVFVGGGQTDAEGPPWAGSVSPGDPRAWPSFSAHRAATTAGMTYIQRAFLPAREALANG